MSRTDEVFKPALDGKKIPVLTLDHKWHQLFTQRGTTKEIKQLEKDLNNLLKRQGKLQSQIKDIKKLKIKLMDDIMSKMEDREANDKTSKEAEDSKRLIAECNQKIEQFQDELMEKPKEIAKLNHQLMLETMDVCYNRIQYDTKEIDEISKWITSIRIELKKKVIQKQEMEAMNQELYSYMHDIFGADVIEIFDMKYHGIKQKNLEENKS